MSDHVLEPVRRARPRARGRAPSRWRRAAWRQYRLERRMFWRNPSAAFFNFLLPLLFLALFGAIFAGEEANLQVIVPGIAGMAVMSTTFSALAMNITYLRESGVLKRIHGTPLPTSAYLAGIVGNAVTNTAIQVALITVGRQRRSSGSTGRRTGSRSSSSSCSASCCFASLGVALSHAIPNFDSAPAYVNAVFLPVIFISGVFYDADDAPQFLRDIAEVLPLKHLIDGLSGAMVTGEGLGRQPARRCSCWRSGPRWTAVLAVRGFSWELAADAPRSRARTWRRPVNAAIERGGSDAAGGTWGGDRRGRVRPSASAGGEPALPQCRRRRRRRCRRSPARGGAARGRRLGEPVRRLGGEREAQVRRRRLGGNHGRPAKTFTPAR